MLLHDYWTDSDVDVLFQETREATGISDPTTIECMSRDKTRLQDNFTESQELLRRACDLLGVTKEGGDRLGLCDNRD